MCMTVDAEGCVCLSSSRVRTSMHGLPEEKGGGDAGAQHQRTGEAERYNAEVRLGEREREGEKRGNRESERKGLERWVSQAQKIGITLELDIVWGLKKISQRGHGGGF